MKRHVIMTLGGIGPKLMLLCLPYIFLSLIVMFQYPEFGQIEFINHNIYKIIGTIWGILVVIFWIYSIIIFLSEFKKGELITRGTFALCGNPVYASRKVYRHSAVMDILIITKPDNNKMKTLNFASIQKS